MVDSKPNPWFGDDLERRAVEDEQLRPGVPGGYRVLGPVDLDRAVVSQRVDRKADRRGRRPRDDARLVDGGARALGPRSARSQGAGCGAPGTREEPDPVAARAVRDQRGSWLCGAAQTGGRSIGRARDPPAVAHPLPRPPGPGPPPVEPDTPADARRVPGAGARQRGGSRDPHPPADAVEAAVGAPRRHGHPVAARRDPVVGAEQRPERAPATGPAGRRRAIADYPVAGANALAVDLDLERAEAPLAAAREPQPQRRAVAAAAADPSHPQVGVAAPAGDEVPGGVAAGGAGSGPDDDPVPTAIEVAPADQDRGPAAAAAAEAVGDLAAADPGLEAGADAGDADVDARARAAAGSSARRSGAGSGWNEIFIAPALAGAIAAPPVPSAARATAITIARGPPRPDTRTAMGPSTRRPPDHAFARTPYFTLYSQRR